MFWLMAAPPVLAVTAHDGIDEPFSLGNSVEVLRDADSQWSTEDVLAGRHDAAFAPAGPGPLGCTNGTVCWVRFSIARTLDAPSLWWLRIRALRPGEVALYEPTTTPGRAPAAQVGRQFPLSWRFVSTDQFFELHQPQPSASYYLRLADTPHADGFSLWQPRGFERQQRQLATYLNTSMGVAFALMMINLVFWRWLRDALFLHFALVMFVAVLLHAWQTVPALTIDEQMGDLNLRGALQCLLQAATTLFTARLFDYRVHAPWAARTAKAYAVFNLLAGAVSLAGHYAAIEPWTAMLELLSLSAAMGLAGWLLFVKRQRQYVWPAALMLALSFSSVLGRLQWLGWMQLGADVTLGASWAAARLFYMLLLAIIVADRTRRAELEVRNARRRALDDALRVERELEARITQRTHELGASNARLADEVERRSDAEASLQVALQSERKALGQQRQFVALVSHEFRNPLAVIDAAAQSIGLPGVETHPRAVKIRRAVQRLALLVDNCLAEERLHADRLKLRIESFDLRVLIEGLIEPLGPADRGRLALDLWAGAALVHGDPALLDIALHNLVLNAIKYSPPEREVRIALWIRGGEACIDVEDQGEGIRPEDQPRIFERFFRGTTSIKASGTGLGLFLCDEIARRHGGAVELLRSDARGSTFRLRIPLQANP